MSSLVLVFLFLSVVSLSSSEASPFRSEKKEEVKKERPLHDTIMERMKKIRESLSMKGQDEEYKRYWEELIANNPGKGYSTNRIALFLQPYCKKILWHNCKNKPIYI